MIIFEENVEIDKMGEKEGSGKNLIMSIWENDLLFMGFVYIRIFLCLLIFLLTVI